MTAPRGKVEASLAERGRPAMWANEQEAAALCGLSPDDFRRRLPSLEADGFPQKFGMNGQRFIPHIERYLLRKLDEIAPAMPELGGQTARDYEDDDESQRRSA